MRKVTFRCDAPQSTGDADIYVAGASRHFRTVRLQDGDQTFLLDIGRYELDIRAIGTPGTRFALRVATGASMRAIDVLLPTAEQVGRTDAGRDAFERKLTVEDE